MKGSRGMKVPWVPLFAFDGIDYVHSSLDVFVIRGFLPALTSAQLKIEDDGGWRMPFSEVFYAFYGCWDAIKQLAE